MSRSRPRLPVPTIYPDVFGPGGSTAWSWGTLQDLGNALLSWQPEVTETRDSRRVTFGNMTDVWDCTVERVRQHPDHWRNHGNAHITVWGSFIGGVYRAVLKDGRWTFYEYRGVMDRGYFKSLPEVTAKRLPLGG